MRAAAPNTTLADKSLISEPLTTSGVIALLNLEAQIDGQELGGAIHQSIEVQIAQIELIILRGIVLGRVADHERAEELAERLVGNEAGDGAIFVVRARTRATFHRFADAMNDLDVAERLAFCADGIKIERAAIFQALGRYEEALPIRQQAADHQPNFETLAALAGLYADRGEIEDAERLFLESRSRYRGVSPFPVAQLDFQRGLMWMNNGQLGDARIWLDAARCRVPAYAPALGHLAEVEAELGDIESAVARLIPLAVSSDDPDYAAQLARILSNAGHLDQSRIWRQQAATRYDELVACHPEAFADHAAEFWLAVGDDPSKALRLARLNFEVRRTPRAYDLLSQATNANETRSRWPELITHSR